MTPGAVLAIVRLLLSIGQALMRHAEERRWYEAGETAAIRKGLDNALRATTRAQDIRSGVAGLSGDDARQRLRERRERASEDGTE